MAQAYDEREAMRRIILDQLMRHRQFHPQDLYKLVHQATCGGGHLLDDLKAAESALAEEWESLEKVQKGEPLLEPIDPRGHILRVNLRVFRKIGGRMSALFDAFVRSAQHVQRDEKRLGDYWQIILDMAGEELPFRRTALEDFYIDMGQKGFPPVHHSKAYAEANLPAYRIVMKQFWEGFIAK